jgi:DNA-binding NarL/FixJ family response regulator
MGVSPHRRTQAVIRSITHRDQTLVGRASERAGIDEAVARAPATGAFLALAGVAGIGKTTLLGYAAARAADAGLRVLGGRGEALAGVAPFGTLAAALEPLVATVPRWQLRRLGDDRLGLLAPVLPELDVTPAAAAALEAERWRTHRALRDLLERLGTDGPLALLLDDVHDADPATNEFLVHVLRRPLLPGVMVVLAYRDLEVPAALARAVGAGELERALTLLRLGPLEETDSAALLGPGFNAAERATLHRQSGGNPFLLGQLARALRRGPGRDPGALPEPLRAGIAGALAELDTAGRRLLRAGAALGEEFDLDVAAAVAELDEETALGAFDGLAAQDLVRFTEPRLAVFLHPLLRRALYEDMPAAERRSLHARAARALERREGSRWAVAHHIGRSARRGDEDAIALLAGTGHAAAIQSPAAAASWFAAARDLLAEDAGPEQRVGLLVPLARAQATSGRLRESRTTLAEALQLAQGPLAVVRPALVTVIGQLGLLIGLGSDGLRLLEVELERTAGAVTPEACSLELSLAANRLVLEEVDPSLELIHATLRKARELGDESAVFAALGLLAFARYQRGEVAAAHEAAADALARFHALTDADVVSRMEVVALHGHTQYALEHFADAAAVLDRALALARSSGAASYFEPLLAGLANTRLWQGSLADADTLCEEAVEAAVVTGNDHARLWGLTLRAWTAWEQGRLGRALHYGGEAVELADAVPLAVFRWAPHVVHGASLLDAGRPEEAREQVLAAGGPGLADIPSSFRTRWYALLVRAELVLGRPEAAVAWAQRADASAAVTGLNGRRGDALAARAAIARGTDDWHAAAALAQQALDAHLAAGIPLDAARDELLAAEALVRTGDPAGAGRLLRAARARALEAGATGIREHAERALAQFGAPIAAGAGEIDVATVAAADLSPRERRVAALVADGHGNGEIATELRVSPRSVERYVTTVRRKLGVPSRAALASLVARHRDAFIEAGD